MNEVVVLKLMLKLKVLCKPCTAQYVTCKCCIDCPDILTCYETWKRGNLRRCKFRETGPAWCSSVAALLATLLAEDKPSNMEFGLEPVPKSRIEEWEDEKTS